MRNVTIHRCPTCPNIGQHTDQLTAELKQDPNLNVRVMDGTKGEFSVEVDGHSVHARDGDSLRAAPELAAEIRGSEVAAAG